jgi:hypothetical protein
VVTLSILLGGVLDQLLRFSVLTGSSLPITFDLGLFVVTMKAVTLAFGTILTWLSYRAFRRTGAPALRALTVGIGLLTAGAVLGGLADKLLDLGFPLGHEPSNNLLARPARRNRFAPRSEKSVLHYSCPSGLLAGVGIQSAFTATGFAVLTYPLYVDGPGADRHVPPDSQGLISPQSGGHTWTLLSRSDSPASVTSEPHSVATSNGRAARSWR